MRDQMIGRFWPIFWTKLAKITAKDNWPQLIANEFWPLILAIDVGRSANLHTMVKQHNWSQPMPTLPDAIR